MRPASVLDGFFSDDVERVVEANRALHAATGGDADKSWGRVEQGVALSSGGRVVERKGILSEVIFGPRKVLACACGALTGEAHRNEACTRCGVLCADPSLREWRFGHVETPPLIHPLFIPEIARTLGLSVGDVQRVLDADMNFEGVNVVDGVLETTGSRAIAARLHGPLAEAAVVTRVPVPPPGDRPLIENLTPTQVTPWIGPVNEAWIAFVNRTSRLTRLEELEAPVIITANEVRTAQAALAQVVAFTQRAPSIHERVGWMSSSPDPETSAELLTLGVVPPIVARPRPQDLDSDELTHGEVHAVFVDDSSFLVQHGLVVQHVTLDGRVVSSFPSPLRRLRSVHGSRVFFERWQTHPYFWVLPNDVEAHVASGSMSDVAIYDMAKAAWLSQWPDDIAAVTAEEGEPEDLGLIDRRSGSSLHASPWGGSDRPMMMAWTADARFAWMGSDDDGGVLEAATGIPQIEPNVERADATDNDDDPLEGGCALGLTDDLMWRFVHADGTLSDGRDVIARLGRADAYAFAPGCKHVVRINSGYVDVLDARGELTRRFRID
jgi:hypothetical protein